MENGHLCSKFCSPNGEGAEFIDRSKKVSIGFAKVTFGPAEGTRTAYAGTLSEVKERLTQRRISSIVV